MESDYDEFFEACVNQNMESQNFESFEEYFDCIIDEPQIKNANVKTDFKLNSGDQKQNPPQKNSNHKQAPKKIRVSYIEDQELRCSANAIQKELDSFRNCCLKNCYLLLTVQMIAYCRSMYILLPSFTERRKWLANQFQQTQTEGCRQLPKFMIDNVGKEYVSVCGDTWRFAYGIPRITYLRQHQSFVAKNILHKRKVEKLVRDIGLTRAQLNFIVWLQRCAEKIGDKLPFGEGNETQIRLPYPTKKVVYETYRHFLQYDCTSVEQPLSYDQCCRLWKSCPDVSHIKMMKHKEGFSKCDKCKAYERAISSANVSVAKREALDTMFHAHILETKKERARYYKSKQKAIANPDKYLSIIIDAMDQKKTTIPYFSNPDKCIGQEYGLKTKLIGAIIHGVGTYLFWTTHRIAGGTNVTVEVLRRTLLKLQEVKGNLPPVLHLQLDNASDNKSIQMLAFLGYLIEKRIFHKITVSYLIVGHTHEDIDQYFSVISRFFKKELKCIYSVSGFITALQTCFKTVGCIPRCIEEIQYCYDTSILSESYCDKHLARFDLDEKTGDKVHYFKITLNSAGKADMQYKIKRYSDALYPRQYNVGSLYQSVSGKGQVIKCHPSKDPISKTKYWNYSVVFKRDDGSLYETVVREPANNVITLFPYPTCLPDSFPIAPFRGPVDEIFGDTKLAIDNIIRKLNLLDSHPNEVQNWSDFWTNIPSEIGDAELPALQPFRIPCQQTQDFPRTRPPIQGRIDDGCRDIQVVTYSSFTMSHRKRAKGLQEATIPDDKLDALHQGDILVVDLQPTNSSWYTLPYVLAEIDRDVSTIDTTNASSEFSVQILRPLNIHNREPLSQKFVKWQGDDRKLWRPTIQRKMVKAIVELTVKSKTLTKKSLQLLKFV